MEDMQNKSVLVTGGAGFIGSHIVRKLAEQNKVEVIDSLDSGERMRLPKGVELHETGLLNREEVSEAISPNTDFVFHLAANSDVRSGAENPRLDLEKNTVATSNLLDMKETGVNKIPCHVHLHGIRRRGSAPDTR